MNTTTPPTSDQELIELLLQGKERGLSLLYDKYSAALFGVILRVVNSQEVAEELLDDTMLKIWNNFAQFDAEKGKLFTWMLNIARNSAIDFVRVKKNMHQNQDLDNAVNSIDRRDNYTPNVDAMGVQEVAQKLSPEHYALIDLIYLNGYTQAETAEQLQIPLGTVKTRLRAAITQLKKLF